MKNTYRFAIAIATAGLSAALLLVPAPGLGQTPTPASVEDQAARARRIAQQFEAQARVLTVFDRQGKVAATLGEPAIYSDLALSPDRTRLVLAKRDLESGAWDIWVLDMTTGKGTRITTSSQMGEFADLPVWSPDGKQVAYRAFRDSYQLLCRKASDGTGNEEILYHHPGSGMILADWSSDGRFLSFSTTDLSGGTLYALPLAGAGERKPIEVLRSESQLRGSRFSPDGRFLAYNSDQSGKNELYVRPFDPSVRAGSAPATESWQVSDQGAIQGGQTAAAYWRRDGKELYYVAADRGLMAVDVSTTPAFKLGKPKLLFRFSEAVPVNSNSTSVSRDGQRVLIALPRAPILPQIVVFDRLGKILTEVGEPGRYVNPALSPDGTRVAVRRTDPRTNNADIWTFDVASGKGTPITNDALPQNNPIWSPDGSQVAYVSTRGSFSSIYRKGWDGTGNEEQLFQYTPGAGLVLTDWSPDGKFLTCYPSSEGTGTGGIILVVPLSGGQKALEREAIEWLRKEYRGAQGRFSPDSRFMAHLSTEIDADTFEVHVRPFDASNPEPGAVGEKSVQVSTGGALGMVFWRQDGKEMYYLNSEWEVMAVDVTTTPTFRAGTPRLLFKLPGRLPLMGNPQQWKNVSADGQRFVFTINVPVSISTR
jgi:Tol biopolymer transport system component